MPSSYEAEAGYWMGAATSDGTGAEVDESHSLGDEIEAGTVADGSTGSAVCV